MDIASYPSSTIFLTSHVARCHIELEMLISTRNAASFASAVPDSAIIYDVPSHPTFSKVEIRMGSDSCTRSPAVPFPAVFGMCHEFAYIYPLQGRWLDVHITGTESLGGFLDFIIFPPLFPWARMVNETDATATHAMLTGRSRSRPLQRMYAVLRRQPEFVEAAQRSASTQVRGKQHVMIDAGSRGYDEVLMAWLSALNMKIRFIALTTRHLQLIDDVLEALLLDSPADAEFDADLGASGNDVAFYDSSEEVIRYMSSPVLPAAAKARESRPLASPCGHASPEPALARSAGSPVPPGAQMATIAFYDIPPTDLQQPSPRRPHVPSPSVALQSPMAPPPPVHSSLRPRASPRLAVAEREKQHERPRNAAAFRALGAARLADRLTDDTSPWRLCPRNPNLLRTFVMQVAQAKAKRIPLNTDKANDNGISWFARACEMLGTPVERPSPSDACHETEAFLGSYAVYYAAMEMKPAERSAVTQLGKVRKTRADPSSALSAYYGARRVLGDFGSYLPPMTSVLQCLKGLRVQMVEEFGDDCFAKVQAQPWPQHYLDAVMAGCSRYELPDWDMEMHLVFLDALVLSLSLGCRKVELPRYMLSHFVWLDPDLVEMEPTASNLARVTDGYWLRLSPVCSKTDYDNAKWGSTRMWFKVDQSEPWSLAARAIARERRWPCQPADRHRTPFLVSPQEAFSAVTGAALVRWLEYVKSVYVVADIAAFLTWHASRVTLASKLVKLRHGWERVQCLLRWEGVQSARIYGRADAEAYNSDITAALRADAGGICPSKLPTLEPTAAMNDMDAAIAAIADDDGRAPADKAKLAAELRGVQPEGRKAAKAAAPPAAPPAPAAATLVACTAVLDTGDVVEYAPRDSCGVAGSCVTIPNAAWGMTDDAKLRYTVLGLSFHEGLPYYVAEVARGALVGSRYLVGPDVIKALMTAAVRKAAGARLKRAPTAI